MAVDPFFNDRAHDRGVRAGLLRGPRGRRGGRGRSSRGAPGRAASSTSAAMRGSTRSSGAAAASRWSGSTPRRSRSSWRASGPPGTRASASRSPTSPTRTSPRLGTFDLVTVLGGVFNCVPRPALVPAFRAIRSVLRAGGDLVFDVLRWRDTPRTVFLRRDGQGALQIVWEFTVDPVEGRGRVVGQFLETGAIQDSERSFYTAPEVTTLLELAGLRAPTRWRATSRSPSRPGTRSRASSSAPAPARPGRERAMVDSSAGRSNPSG